MQSQGQARPLQFVGVEATNHAIGVKGQVDMTQRCGLRHSGDWKVRAEVLSCLFWELELQRNDRLLSRHLFCQPGVVLGRVNKEQIKTNGFRPKAVIIEALEQLGVLRSL